MKRLMLQALLVICSSLLFVAGCVTEPRMATPSPHKRATTAAAAATATQLPAAPGSLLSLMQEAMEAHLAGEWAASNGKLELCLQTIQAQPDIRLGEEAGSYLFSEQLRAYEGDPFELVFLHTLGMLNYAMLGQVGEGLVEARRADQLQRALADQGKLLSDDALSRLISAGLYEAQGQYDDAYIDLQRARKAFVELEKHGGPDAPKFMGEELIRIAQLSGRQDELKQLRLDFPDAPVQDPQRKGWASVWVLAYSGQVTQHSEGPRISGSLADSGISDGKRASKLERVYKIEPTLFEAGRVRSGGETARNVSRVVVRTALLVGLAVLTKGNIGNSDAAGELLESGVQKEQRRWANLPARVDACRLWLRPGRHRLKLSGTIDGDARMVPLFITLKAGATALLRVTYNSDGTDVYVSPAGEPGGIDFARASGQQH